MSQRVCKSIIIEVNMFKTFKVTQTTIQVIWLLCLSEFERESRHAERNKS